MDERDWLAERFEANRTHLRAVAYRMLGSVSAADDALQESCCGSAAPTRRKDPVRPLMASVYGALHRIESNRAASPRRAAA